MKRNWLSKLPGNKPPALQPASSCTLLQTSRTQAAPRAALGMVALGISPGKLQEGKDFVAGSKGGGTAQRGPAWAACPWAPMSGGIPELQEPAQLQSPATAREETERTHRATPGSSYPFQGLRQAALCSLSHVHVAGGSGAETTEPRLLALGGTNTLPVGPSAEPRLPCLLSSKYPAG